MIEINAETLLKHMLDTFYRSDLEGRLVFVSPSVHTLTGYSVDELVGTQLADLYVQKDQRDQFLHQLKEKKGKLTGFKSRLRHKNGEELWVSTSATYYYDESGHIAGVEGITRDVTVEHQFGDDLEKLVHERTLELQGEIKKVRQAERAKEESEEKFRRIVENIQDVYYETDLDGTIYYCSPSCLPISGYSQPELIGNNASILYSDPADRELLLVPLRKGGAVRDLELVFKKKNGEIYDVSFNADLYFDENGEPLGLSGTIRDITATKRIKEQIQRSRKMEAIGLMAGGVAHDLNNILSGIIGYPELLLQNIPKDSELYKPLVAVHESGQRAATVVADLLTVARGAASTRQIHSLNLLIEEYVHSPEGRKLKSLHPNVQFKQHCHSEQGWILCSPVHVKKCLMNLVTNAAEAISGAGIVLVSTCKKNIDDAAASKHSISKGDYIVLSVQDTGPGITETDLKRIYEPFYSTKIMGRSGTGLGLTVVWNTMEDHEGKVRVQSNVEGTCFQLYFPVSKEQGVESANSDSTEGLRGNNEHVLIVDDELLLRDIASRMLLSLGYKVDAVSSGEMAIAFVKENPVDLLVLDMLMEPGINGRQTYEEISALSPGQKALIVSGFSESDEVKKAINLGAGGFVKKPYSLEQLGRAVKTILT